MNNVNHNDKDSLQSNGRHILFLGPDFRNPKGGVASVLSEYKKIFPSALFVASTHSYNILTKIGGFVKGFFYFLFVLLRHPHIKIIHIHGASYSSFYRKFIFFQLSRLFRKKVIYHIHGAEYDIFCRKANPLKRRLIENFINHSDCIVCLSERWKKFFEMQFSPKRITIIPNIIQEPDPEFTKLAGGGEIKKFLFLGEIGERKGSFLLLEVLSGIKEEIRGKAVFYLGGNGEIKRFKNLIRKYELDDIVKFVGWVSGEFKTELLKSADVYLLPSYNEGLPISILEAMSYSLPVLSTTAGGIPEIVTKENGILIEPGNKDELAKAICFFINARESTLLQMGEISLRLSKRHLPEATLTSLNELYENMLT